jgi:flagellar biosynthesis/type III secretory pathway M-ring protein FliF/YscJ
MESKPASPGISADEQADLLMALLGEDGAAAALGAAVGEGPADPAMAFAAGKKEIRSRVRKLAAERPEFLAKIITHWLKEERFKGR